MTDLITGKSAEEAIAILEHLPKATALPLGRVTLKGGFDGEVLRLVVALLSHP